MQLTREDIEEYQAIYKKAFGEEITAAEAEAQGSQLIELYMIFQELRAHDPEGFEREELEQRSLRMPKRYCRLVAENCSCQCSVVRCD